MGADLSKRPVTGGRRLTEHVNIVRSVDDLNLWLRHFAPRITLRVSAADVIATSSVGELRMPARISFAREGERSRIVAAGDDPLESPGATTVELFSADAINRDAHDDWLRCFLSLVMKRLPRSAGFIRPIVVVRGLMWLPAAMRDGQKVARALQACGATAVVLDDLM